MVFVKMRPIPPLQMESKTCQLTKRASRLSNELGPKNLSKACMKVNRKIQASAKSSRRTRTHKANRKVYVQNIEIGFRKQLEHPPNPESTLGW
jgi:hypothetical protein